MDDCRVNMWCIIFVCEHVASIFGNLPHTIFSSAKKKPYLIYIKISLFMLKQHLNLIDINVS